jgi:hypothetical protein
VYADFALRELTSEFLDWLEGRVLVVGSVVLLGSVFQLSVDGTGQYVEDWHHCQRRLKEAVEGLMVLPLIPVPMEGVKDKETVRSLLEFPVVRGPSGCRGRANGRHEG